MPPVDEVSPTVLFGGVDAETWRWLNLEGCEICPFLARYLPALPAEAEQARVTPRSGQEGLELGFQIYTLFSAAVRGRAWPTRERQPRPRFRLRLGARDPLLPPRRGAGESRRGRHRRARRQRRTRHEPVVPIRALRGPPAELLRRREFRPCLRVLRLLSPLRGSTPAVVGGVQARARARRSCAANHTRAILHRALVNVGGRPTSRLYGRLAAHCRRIHP